jgi:predicted AlkP superfamily phosphohydrolase/phosphomutase
MIRFRILFAAAAVLIAGCSHTPRAALSKRMIVVGVDGMDPTFLEQHWDALPNLNRLRHIGDFRRLRTTVPPQSPVAWSSVTTGMDPGGHGVFDFVHRDPATRMAISSMAKTTPPKYEVPIGPYRIPLSSGSVRLSRGGTAFWQTLEKHGIKSTVIRMPANYPPAECESESLSGMGTPDVQGSAGTFTLFTDDPSEHRNQVPGGRIVHLQLKAGQVKLLIEGPANPFRRDGTATAVGLIAHVDPLMPVARFDLDGQQLVLRQGEWSNWIAANFPFLGAIEGLSGIFRIYLQQVHPNLRVYVSPVQIDPAAPTLPISMPAHFSRTLTGALGRFYTQGIPEETSAFRTGIFNRAEFLTQSHKVLADGMRMFNYELAHSSGSFLFYYFSSVDQNSHMLWGRYDSDLLEIYKMVDQAIGDAMQTVDGNTVLMVISDHGFAKFDRAVHLNSWLAKEGLLTLDDAANAGDEELFAHIDWTRTRAYALGLNGIYLNQEGRENGGIVSPLEKRMLLEKIRRDLLALKDPDTGQNVVGKVYTPETDYVGRNLKYAPDLIVGYHRGYRASWQTALGAVPKVVIEDNTQAWIGDHCMEADEVPGVLLSNRKIHLADPGLTDIASTILDYFSVPLTPDMIGRSVF